MSGNNLQILIISLFWVFSSLLLSAGWHCLIFTSAEKASCETVVIRSRAGWEMQLPPLSFLFPPKNSTPENTEICLRNLICVCFLNGMFPWGECKGKADFFFELKSDGRPVSVITLRQFGMYGALHSQGKEGDGIWDAESSADLKAHTSPGPPSASLVRAGSLLYY